MRFRFGRAHNIIAVADSDEFADAHGTTPHAYDTTLTSAPVRVSGEDHVDLTFDSHYRGWAGQSGTVLVAFRGGEPQAGRGGTRWTWTRGGMDCAPTSLCTLTTGAQNDLRPDDLPEDCDDPTDHAPVPPHRAGPGRHRRLHRPGWVW